MKKCVASKMRDGKKRQNGYGGSKSLSGAACPLDLKTLRWMRAASLTGLTTGRWSAGE